MKRGIIILSALLLLAGCGNSDSRKAAQKLSEAQAAFEQGDYNGAKLQLDSIKLLYPKEFDIRRQGNLLMREVELKEQKQGKLYLDSLLAGKQQQVEAMLPLYTLEKDAEYQQTGNYFWPTQTTEKNLHRSFLRFQVSELGVMTMTSIYCGSQNIHHSAVKAAAPDGSFARTPGSKDSYETTDLGEKIEKADYKMGDDGSLISFLYLNRDKNLQITFLGERPLSVPFTPADRLALANIYDLAQLLSSIQQIKKEIAEADLKIKFVERFPRGEVPVRKKGN